MNYFIMAYLIVSVGKYTVNEKSQVVTFHYNNAIYNYDYNADNEVNAKKAAYKLKLLQRGFARKQPVGIIVDDKVANKVTDVLFADNDLVASVDATSAKDMVKVTFMGHAGFYFMKNDNKKLKENMTALLISERNKKRVWFITAGSGTELEVVVLDNQFKYLD